MKKLILFLALSAPLFWACDDDDDDVTPKKCIECAGVKTACEGDDGATLATLQEMLLSSTDSAAPCKLVDK